jgi:Iron-regulated ABC transporter membrane component SufB
LEEQFVGSNEAEYKEKYGFNDKIEYKFKTKKGLSEDIVREISHIKGEPDWMLEKRLSAYKVFTQKPMPTWGADLSKIDFDDIYYYMRPTDKSSDSWESVPEDIKKTFDKLGIPEAERKFFAGAEAQYDSEVVYHNLREDLTKQGVIFVDTDTAVKEYPELMKKYFGTVIPSTDNKFAALNTAVWSGGSFIYVPKGVKLAMPLQAYFRINGEKAGQFERTLIIADEGADVTYIEGCFTKGY